MRIVSAACVVAIVLGGCSTTSYYRNVLNPGFGQAEFDRDDYQCQRENTHVGGAYLPGVGGVSGPNVNQSMVAQCLYARGWRLVKR